MPCKFGVKDYLQDCAEMGSNGKTITRKTFFGSSQTATSEVAMVKMDSSRARPLHATQRYKHESAWKHETPTYLGNGVANKWLPVASLTNSNWMIVLANGGMQDSVQLKRKFDLVLLWRR